MSWPLRLTERELGPGGRAGVGQVRVVGLRYTAGVAMGSLVGE